MEFNPAALESDSRLLPALRMANRVPAGSDITSAETDTTGARVIVDYLDATSALQFARSFNPHRVARANGLGPGWQHSFDVVLGTSNEQRVIHDGSGKRHLFSAMSENDPGVFIGQERSDGRLTETASGHEWSLPDGWRFRFHGSHLTMVSHDFEPWLLSLYYQDDLLVQVTDERGRKLALSYEGRQLRAVETPIGTLMFEHGFDGSLDSASDASGRKTLHTYRDTSGTVDARRPGGTCAPENVPDQVPASSPGTELDDNPLGETDDDANPAASDDKPNQTLLENLHESVDEPQACDTDNSPPPEGFLTPSLDPLVIRVDARPGSCQSYFVDFEGIDRGQAIESGFEGHDRYDGFEATVNSFPIVDFITDEGLLIVISRDLISASYNDPASPDALYDTLMRDARAIQSQLLHPLQEQGSLEVSENGQTTRLTVDEVGKPVLEVVIQYDMATPAQRDQIRRAAEDMMVLHGIELRVIEIP